MRVRSLKQSRKIQKKLLRKFREYRERRSNLKKLAKLKFKMYNCAIIYIGERLPLANAYDPTRPKDGNDFFETLRRAFKMFNELLSLNEKHGRNFRNLLIKKTLEFESRSERKFNSKYTTYSDDVSLRDILKQPEVKTRLLMKLSNPVAKLEPILIKWGGHIQDLPPMSLGDDWAKWHRWVLRQSIILYKAFPAKFLELSNYLTDSSNLLNQENANPVRKRSVNRKKYRRSVIKKKCRRSANEGCNGYESNDDNFKRVLKMIDDSKKRESFGYLLKKQVYFVANARKELGISESITIPQPSMLEDEEKLFPEGVLYKADPCYETYADVIKRRKLSYSGYHVMTKLTTNGSTPTSGEGMDSSDSSSASGDSNGRKGSPGNSSVPAELPFQVSRPFPSKGGFKEKVLQNNSLDDRRCFSC